MNAIATAAKAVFATIATLLAALGAVLVDNHTISDVTDAQWVVVLGAALAAGYGVYQTPNKAAAKEQPGGPATQRPATAGSCPRAAAFL